MRTVSSTPRMPSTAAWSAASFSPRPIQRAAAIAAASVTRTSSSAMFRSGAGRLLTTPGFLRRAQLHGVARDRVVSLHPDLGDHVLRGIAVLALLPRLVARLVEILALSFLV